MKNKTSGFTLIELLVIVLIIGILSSIALPQYRKSVEKSRAANALVDLKVLYDAEKIYHDTYEKYTQDIDELDVQVSTVKKVQDGLYQTSYGCIRLTAESVWTATEHVALSRNLNSGNTSCGGKGSFGDKVCQALGRKKVTSGTNFYVGAAGGGCAYSGGRIGPLE